MMNEVADCLKMIEQFEQENDRLRALNAELLEALEEIFAVAELFVPVPLQAPGFKRARAAIAKARLAPPTETGE